MKYSDLHAVWVNGVTISLAYIIVDYQLTNFFAALSAQTHHNDEPKLDLYDEFNIDSHVETVNNKVNDDQILELTYRNPSKMAKAMAIEVMSLLL